MGRRKPPSRRLGAGSHNHWPESSAAREQWEARFYDILDDFRFLPGGRILAGAGSGKVVTLCNCFAMGPTEDSLDGIFDALKEGAVTMQQDGGIGYDFSTLRPGRGTGARRAAMMGTLRCDHPDIESFVDAKREGAELRNFNLSVLVTDMFMQAVKRDEPWSLLFPITPSWEATDVHGGRIVMRAWPPDGSPVPCRVFRVVPARALWRRIMQATYDYAEPGVLFIDRMNRMNNLWYREQICTTNPCGEILLPPYGASRGDQSDALRQPPFSFQRPFRYRGARSNDRNRGSTSGQRHRRIALSA